MARLIFFFKNRRGQAIIELALILPVFLLIVFGGLEIGNILHKQLLLTSASREGARTGAIGAGDNAIRDEVKKVASSLNLSDSDIVITPGEGLRSRGSALKVKVSHNVELFTPVLNNILPSTFHLTAETTMRVE